MSEVKTPVAEAPATPPAVEIPAPPAAESGKETIVTPPDNKQGEVKVEPALVETPKPPETYELKARKDSPLLKDDLAEIESLAKAKGLSQEDAQKMVEGKEADHDKFFQRQQQQARDQMASWRKEVESDKEIAGSDGKAFKENVELAHRALSRFADEPFKKVLAESGLGNNPHLIRTFLRIGKGMADDKAVLDGKSTSPGAKTSLEQKMYPTHFKEKKE